MTRSMLLVALLFAAASTARADDTRVRTSATVEVLDDKAQIDDVISRLRQQQQTVQPLDAAKVQPNALKLERPPAPTALDAAHRPVAPESKDQRAGSRRTSGDRTANPERTERPHVHRR